VLRLVAAMMLFTVVCCPGQELNNSRKVQLRLHPKSIVRGMPQAFEFEIVNTQNGDIRIPTPAIFCFSARQGYIAFYRQFTPRSVVYGPSSGYGCGSGVYDGPTVLERAKTWKILQRGQSLRIVARRDALFYEDKEPGTYEFWATYFPPILSISEQKLLRDAGITTAEGETASAHVTFVKSR